MQINNGHLGSCVHMQHHRKQEARDQHNGGTATGKTKVQDNDDIPVEGVDSYHRTL